MAHHSRHGLPGSPLCVLAFGAWLWGCGGTGDAPAAAEPPNAGATDGDLGLGDSVAPGAEPAAAVAGDSIAESGAAAACADSFRACGGPLLGEWQVEGTCEPAAQDRVAAQRWTEGLLALDALACSDALQTLTSLWGGSLTFRDGEADDARSRADTLELRLTPDCLSATLGEAVTSADLGAACAGLSGESILCSPAEGACRCAAQREEQPGGSGPYAVLNTSVAIGTTQGVRRVDYCVQADVLHWREPSSDQRLVLRRVPAAP